MAFIRPIFFGILLPFCLYSQSPAWEIGPVLGISAYSGDLAEGRISMRGSRPLAGFQAIREWTPSTAMRLQSFYARLKGDDRYYSHIPWRIDRAFRFSTDLFEISSTVEWRPIASWLALNGLPNTEEATLTPYLFTGLGLAIFKPHNYFAPTKNEELFKAITADQEADYAHTRLVIPFGAGVRWRVPERWAIRVEAGVRPAFTDYLDGVSRSGNPAHKDWYTFFTVGATVRLGKKDSDWDGVVDELDGCPFLPGPRSQGGCPDSDGDGVSDQLDLCPNQPGMEGLGGCPDADRDGIADKDDLCPNAYGPFERGGCPVRDSDGDGVEDNRDACPTQPGPPERQGCPALDFDQDGILDEDDQCPNQFGLAIFGGCPDTDGDGIEDRKDACPEQFGLFANNGCPELSKPEEEAQAISRQYITFEPQSREIQRFALLSKIANFLRDNRDFRLIIKGYADIEGAPAFNDQLSQQRAQACLQYLRDQGIAADRVQIQSFGARYAINNSPAQADRAFNRRVEFELFK
ncbi:MAG: OmpA family protein [Lewinellaceae bacterium]|nr:OmpA family protein [Lewinella sp.]MCB9280335.1 OmpA family protein [Lewinellaceae bacterium]